MSEPPPPPSAAMVSEQASAGRVGGEAAEIDAAVRAIVNHVRIVHACGGGGLGPITRIVVEPLESNRDSGDKRCAEVVAVHAYNAEGLRTVARLVQVDL